MKTPKLSVLLPVFNGEKYIKNAMKNIYSQTFKDLELIIINDCSTDRTLQIIKKNKYGKIKILTNPKNLGVARSLNKGLQHCNGEYIARVDVDDPSSNDRFEKQVNFLKKHRDYILVGTNCQWINEKGKRIKGFSVETDDAQIRRKMYLRNQFHHSSVMFQSKVVKKLGGYRTLLNGVEDYDLWFRLQERGKVHNFEEKLIKRRVYKDAVSTKNHLKIELLALFVRLVHAKGILS